MLYKMNETMRMIGKLDSSIIDDSMKQKISDIVRAYDAEPKWSGKNFMLSVDSFLLGYKYGRENGL